MWIEMCHFINVQNRITTLKIIKKHEQHKKQIILNQNLVKIINSITLAKYQLCQHRFHKKQISKKKNHRHNALVLFIYLLISFLNYR